MSICFPTTCSGALFVNMTREATAKHGYLSITRVVSFANIIFTASFYTCFFSHLLNQMHNGKK